MDDCYLFTKRRAARALRKWAWGYLLLIEMTSCTLSSLSLQALFLSFLLSLPLSSVSLFSFGWLVVILGGTDHWIWEWHDEHGLGEEEGFPDWWMNDASFYIFYDSGYVHIDKRWHRHIFWWFDVRLHYTLQLTIEKEMFWRFCCGMEPISMTNL